MKNRLLISFIIMLVLMSFLPSYAVEKITDKADLSNYIADCEQFGTYEEVAEALLCAACIPYGESPEQCVAVLQDKGFEFQYTISTELPYNVTSFDVTYSTDGGAELPMIREVAVVFSPAITLYMRTEAQMISLVPANDEAGIQDGNIWMPNEDMHEGKIVGAHLQFFDESSQEWITWTFMSPENYKEA